MHSLFFLWGEEINKVRSPPVWGCTGGELVNYLQFISIQKMSCAQGTKLMGSLVNHNDLTNSPKCSIFLRLYIYNLPERLVRGLDTTHTRTKQNCFCCVISTAHAGCCVLVWRVPGCLLGRHISHLHEPGEQVFLVPPQCYWLRGLLFQSKTEKPDKNSAVRQGGRAAWKMKCCTQGKKTRKNMSLIWLLRN